jgi:hypothetical protein
MEQQTKTEGNPSAAGKTAEKEITIWGNDFRQSNTTISFENLNLRTTVNGKDRFWKVDSFGCIYEITQRFNIQECQQCGFIGLIDRGNGCLECPNCIEQENNNDVEYCQKCGDVLAVGMNWNGEDKICLACFNGVLK